MQGGKTKTKMDDLHQDSQTGLPTDYFAMCFEHFEASCFNRSTSVLIGTPVYFERFYLEKGSVPSIYAKSKDSLDIDYPWNEGDLQIDFFWETFFRSFFGTPLLPYWEMSVSKIDFFFDWVGLYSRYVFNLLALQIHDIVNEDGPILESRCIQLRHTKL